MEIYDDWFRRGPKRPRWTTWALFPTWVAFVALAIAPMVVDPENPEAKIVAIVFGVLAVGLGPFVVIGMRKNARSRADERAAREGKWPSAPALITDITRRQASGPNGQSRWRRMTVHYEVRPADGPPIEVVSREEWPKSEHPVPGYYCVVSYDPERTGNGLIKNYVRATRISNHPEIASILRDGVRAPMIVTGYAQTGPVDDSWFDVSVDCAVYPAGGAAFSLSGLRVRDSVQGPAVEVGYDGVACFDPADPTGRSVIALCSTYDRRYSGGAEIAAADAALQALAEQDGPAAGDLPPEAFALIGRAPGEVTQPPPLFEHALDLRGLFRRKK